MAEELNLEELEAELELKRRELRLTGDGDARSTAFAEFLQLKSRIAALERLLGGDSVGSSSASSEIPEPTVEELERIREESYSPGPGDAPAYEPLGYAAIPGFVKSRPENNEHYVEGFRNHPWYPAISSAHRQLEELIPGYNISQIKEKFGELRYYFSYPELIPTRDDWPAYSTEDKVRAMVDRVIARAEGWVEGYEAAQHTTDRSIED